MPVFISTPPAPLHSIRWCLCFAFGPEPFVIQTHNVLLSRDLVLLFTTSSWMYFYTCIFESTGPAHYASVSTCELSTLSLLKERICKWICIICMSADQLLHKTSDVNVELLFSRTEQFSLVSPEIDSLRRDINSGFLHSLLFLFPNFHRMEKQKNLKKHLNVRVV